MRRPYKIITLLALLMTLAASQAYAQERLYVKHAEFEQGTSGTIELMLDNTDSFYGFQAALTLPAGIEVVKYADGHLDMTLQRTEGYLFISNVRNGIIYMDAYSPEYPHKPISGTSGALVTINVRATKDFRGGNATLKDVRLVTADDQDKNLSSTFTPIGVLPTKIDLWPKQLTLFTGDNSNFEPQFTPIYTTNESLVWESSDESVVTVDKTTGLLTAISNGDATITATTVNGKTATGNITVLTATEGVIINPTELTIEKGDVETVTASIRPMTSTDPPEWTSSDPTVATVTPLPPLTPGEQNGGRVNARITALKPGSTVITVKSGEHEATCIVTVEISPTEIDLPEAALVYVGRQATIPAKVYPLDATYMDKTLTWTSSDESIATVDSEGCVTGIVLGEVTITATAATLTGTVSAECKVTVIPVPAESITLTPPDASLMVGQTVTIEATVNPDDTTYPTVTWATDDATVARVDATGLVTAVGLGTAKIIASCDDATAKAIITVIPTPAQSITLSQTEASLKVGATLDLTAEIKPDDTTYKTVTWTTDDETIATVDASGRITAIALGRTTITATCGDATATCAITVIPTPVESMTLTNSTLLMRVGYTTELSAIVRPADATDPSVVWTSDNESIVTVDSEGTVSAIAVGEATVTATSVSNPAVKATCVVTVETDGSIIGVTGIIISDDAIDLIEGDTFALSASITPDDATDKTITWKSSDRTVVTVSETGEVTAVAPGTATVYASASNGLTADCFVTVTARTVDPTGISLSNTTLLMREGHTAELIAVVVPDNATDKTVVWRSDDTSIATVDQNGIVTSLKIGTATITATTVNGLAAECIVTVVPEIIAVTDISVNPPALTLFEGETATLTATITPDDATDKTVTWKSSDRAVATVDSRGVVTAVSVGSATIYASSSNGLTVECAVTVAPPAPIPVASLTLSNSEMVMREGHTAELLAIIRPADATDQSVTWSTDDEAIATVDQNGIVTAIKQGVTRIFATTANGLTAVCVVTVVPAIDIIAVAGITLDRTELTLIEGDTYTLTATITPDNASDKTVTWRSSDRAVATLDESGMITAVAPGTATIYASSSNGLTAECALTVISRAPIMPTSITLSNSELLMREGYTADLIAIVHPSDATDKTVTWTSDDFGVASVDQNGLVTAIMAGQTRITATTVNGLSAYCAVTVVPEIIAVTGISLNKSELSLTETETFDLIATITPDNATDKTVTWLSSNTEAATVSDAGVVTAVKAGSATIYASSSNGLTATCDVTVSPLSIEVITVTVDPTEIILAEGETATLTATVTPEDATDPTVTWNSNNTDIATVENGIVTGVKAGTATISAKSVNGKAAYCAVTVNERPHTPRQLLRKGDGTTCTFVVMMDLPDTELTERGYRYAVGYTDRNGRSQIIAETPLRYCHTTPEIYNQESYDFWTFAYFETANGIVNSNLRHLDGREEICFDASIFRRGTLSTADDDEWIKVTSSRVYITPTTDGEMHVEIFGMTGVPVYSRALSGGATATHEIDLSRFAVGSYVVAARCGNRMQSKKIVVR